MIKNKRGQKLCKKCGGINGARAAECKHCENPFNVKLKRKKSRIVTDWHDLQPGDCVKVIGGNGTYYIDSAGQRQYLVDRGVYIINNKTENGLQVYGKHGGGYSFLYMGEAGPSSTFEGLYRAPHKLLKCPS